MMANPHEFRDTLWTVLYTGQLTPEMQQKAAKNAAENAKKAIGKAPPKAALNELDRMLAKAAELRAQRGLPPGPRPKE